jgi:hypothetical protein
MTIDSPELRTLVRTGIAAAFAELRASHPSEHVYAFGLFTDDDASGIVPTANSEEALAALAAKHQRMGAGFVASLRWSWWEWNFGGSFGKQHIQAGYRAIFDMERDDFGAFRQSVLSLMSAVLSDLDAEGIFGRGADRESITLFCSISDSEEAEELFDRSVQALNPPSVVAQYEAGRGA